MELRAPALAESRPSDAEPDQLERWVRDGRPRRHEALHMRIVLERTTVLLSLEAARRFGFWLPRVHQLAFAVPGTPFGRSGPLTAPGPASARVRVEQTVAGKLESTPFNATIWALTKMTEKPSLSNSSISRIRRIFSLGPR